MLRLLKRCNSSAEVVVYRDNGVDRTCVKDFFNHLVRPKQQTLAPAVLDGARWNDEGTETDGCQKRDTLEIHQYRHPAACNQVHFKIHSRGAFDIESAIENDLNDVTRQFFFSDFHPFCLSVSGRSCEYSPKVKNVLQNRI